MIGIVLISHDDFCVGMLHAAEMICGDLGGQIVTVGLAKDAPVETFDEALRRAVKTVDTGDGIVILADLAGGTPFNRAAPLAGTSVRLFGVLAFGHAGLREFVPAELKEEELL